MNNPPPTCPSLLPLLLFGLLAAAPARAAEGPPPRSDAEEVEARAEVEPTEARAEVEPTETRAWLWVKPSFGLAYGPLGLVGDVKAQLRRPLHRSDSILFQNTYLGIGGRVALTPAFLDVGPRFSIAPIDIFDVDIQLGYVGVWPGSSGLLPYDELGGTLDRERNARADEAVASDMIYAAVTPTLKFRIGPVIGFTSAEFAFLHVRRPDSVDSPYVYDAWRNLLVAWDDVALTSLSGLLFEILDGQSSPATLRVGALCRHRQAFVSGARQTALGGAVALRPGRKEAVPTFLLAGYGYLRENDRAIAQGAAAADSFNIQLQASWNIERVAVLP